MKYNSFFLQIFTLLIYVHLTRISGTGTSENSDDSDLSDTSTEVLYLQSESSSDVVENNLGASSNRILANGPVIDSSKLYYLEAPSENVQYVLVDTGDSGDYNSVSRSVSNRERPLLNTMPIQMPRYNQRLSFGPGGKIQWTGGPVNFDNMVDCKFYRQNPGFCVPMSIYTPCSRCKAGVRTIFRTSYRVRCPGPESFPAELRPYFVWVPTAHRNLKRENKIFSRWRRQFMCIVMAVSEVPRDLSRFWEQVPTSGNSMLEAPFSVPLLLGPYGDQSSVMGLGTEQGNINYIGYDSSYQPVFTAIDPSNGPQYYTIV